MHAHNENTDGCAGTPGQDQHAVDLRIRLEAFLLFAMRCHHYTAERIKDHFAIFKTLAKKRFRFQFSMLEYT